MKPHLQTAIWTLLRAGNAQREIKLRTGTSRHTIRDYAKRFAAQADPPGDSNCSGMATDASTDSAGQTAPPRPPASAATSPPGADAAASLCKPHRVFIEAQLRLGRNAMAIYQDLVDGHGLPGRYNSVRRFILIIAPQQ